MSTIDDAIALVGTSQVRALALAYCFNGAFPMAPGLDREASWRASQPTAALPSSWRAASAPTAKSLAERFHGAPGRAAHGPERAGCLFEFEKQPQYPGARWECETALLGFTEGQVDVELARACNFPDTMVNALDAVAARWPPQIRRTRTL